MKITLIGYGRMGKAIESLLGADDQVVAKVHGSESLEKKVEKISKCDVAIEFSHPKSAFYNLNLCLDHGIPVVCGTTGWLDRFEEMRTLVAEKDGALFYA
ncbi:MAG: 4-hydroxy-tetrahydrodipicolinate reductase, partial [Saprospiraceae bacterium]|nr:4-hydroxy-tetrahydrodipicolinate reductase [Saprospiraceae bacterium]